MVSLSLQNTAFACGGSPPTVLTTDWRRVRGFDPHSTHSDRLFAFDYQRTASVRSRFHSHPNHELFYFHEGEGRYLVGADVFTLSPGDLLIMHGMTLHCPRMTPGRRFVRSVLHFDPRFPARAAEVLHTDDLHRSFRGLGNARLRLTGASKEEMEVLLAEFSAIGGGARSDRSGRARLRFLDLLAFVGELMASVVPSPAIPKEPEILVQNALAFVEDHYTEGFSLGELAAGVGVSKAYIARIFRRITGCTVFQYVNVRRVNEAKLRFLLDGASRTTDVALDVGFKQLSHFSRVFRTISGLSPKEYRTGLSMYSLR